MYAIVKIGGKQFRVQKGDVIDVSLPSNNGYEPGSEMDFAEVLFYYDGSQSLVGTPNVADCFVTGKFVGPVKGPKITSIKYIPGNHRRRIGHRQPYWRFEITEIGSHKRKGK